MSFMSTKMHYSTAFYRQNTHSNHAVSDDITMYWTKLWKKYSIDALNTTAQMIAFYSDTVVTSVH